jgi:hypothetical protein
MNGLAWAQGRFGIVTSFGFVRVSRATSDWADRLEAWEEVEAATEAIARLAFMAGQELVEI